MDGSAEHDQVNILAKGQPNTPNPVSSPSLGRLPLLVLALQRSAGNRTAGAFLQRLLMPPSAPTGTEPMAGWAAAWRGAIEALRGPGGPLSAQNGAIALLLNGRFKDQAINFGVKTQEFETSLLDPAADPSAARMKLDEIRSLFRKPDAHPNASSFPTAAYTSLLEPISAKRLWQRGETSLHPDTGETSTDPAKPDYAVAGKHREEEVGDHVRVSNGKDAGEVQDQIIHQVTDKLATYSGRRVRVVVDASDKAAILDPKTIDADIQGKLSKIHPASLSRLTGVYLVLGNDVHKFSPPDWE